MLFKLYCTIVCCENNLIQNTNSETVSSKKNYFWISLAFNILAKLKKHQRNVYFEDIH